jgi:hypothetical protein
MISKRKDIPVMRQKGKNWMNMIWLVVFIIVCHLILCHGPLFGYPTSVHKKITLKAVDKIRSSLNERLKQIGLENGVDHTLETWDKNTILEWIQYGSHWEDLIAFYWFSELPKKNIINCHFHNPLYDLGLYEENNGIRIANIRQIYKAYHDY